MKAPGFPTQMGEEPGAFRMYVGGACRVVALVEPPLILKDDAGTPPSPPQAHFSPWNERGTPASAGQDPMNTRQNQPGG